MTQPDPSIRSQCFIVEENRRGNAGSVTLLGMFTGRLVDVYDGFEGAGGEVAPFSLQQTDFVIGQDVVDGMTVGTGADQQEKERGGE